MKFIGKLLSLDRDFSYLKGIIDCIKFFWILLLTHDTIFSSWKVVSVLGNYLNKPCESLSLEIKVMNAILITNCGTLEGMRRNKDAQNIMLYQIPVGFNKSTVASSGPNDLPLPMCKLERLHLHKRES